MLSNKGGGKALVVDLIKLASGYNNWFTVLKQEVMVVQDICRGWHHSFGFVVSDAVCL